MAWSVREDRECVGMAGPVIADEHGHWDGSHGCGDGEISWPAAGAAGLGDEASGSILKACPACPKISGTSKQTSSEYDPHSGPG
jgi:hypothetical protein